MATQLLMPQLGQNVLEGKISRWLKKVGDAVTQAEPVVEVETEKVTTEIKAETAGVLLAILVEEGTVVRAGTPLAIIGQPGESVDYVMEKRAARGAGHGDRLVPHSNLRRSIAEHMVRSKRTSPHASTFFEVDMSRVIAHKAACERDGVRLTLTAYFVAAAARALQAHPVINSTFTDEGLLFRQAIHIGLAVSLGPEGLMVPVLKDADQLSLAEIAHRISDLAGRARRKALTPDDVVGATFTITNHGAAGSLWAIPVINQPNVAILSVGALHKRPVVVMQEGVETIAIRPVVYIGLTFDHRVLDGALADAFVADVKKTLETWGMEEEPYEGNV